MYLGHGEWTQVSEDNQTGQSTTILQEAEWVQQWLATVDPDIQIHQQVIRNGYPNRWGAKIPVKTKWNLKLLEEWLHNYEDKEIVEWMKYGWPTGRLPTLPSPGICSSNHKGATEFPEHLKKYVHKELGHGAIMGPYKKIPFSGHIGISPKY